MGIPASGARWRSNRACRGNGAVTRPDPAPSCLLGLVWHQTIDQTQRSLRSNLTPAQKIPAQNAVLCIETGLAFLRIALTMTMANLLAGRIAARFGLRLPTIGGLLVGAAGCVLLSQQPLARLTRSRLARRSPDRRRRSRSYSLRSTARSAGSPRGRGLRSGWRLCEWRARDLRQPTLIEQCDL
jgi:hypothetical protein